MATVLAPYTNGMRLGQGYNSYTQQICLDQAVKLDPTARSRASGSQKSIVVGQRRVPPRSEAISLTVDAPLDLEDAGPPAGEDDQFEVDDEPAPEPDESVLEVPPWVKPQIVTYSSRFVDKLSDVTDSMNISGTVAIKTATIGGKLAGSYIDSDKFKSSDINFHLQVKVVNQVHNAEEYSIFNRIEGVSDSDFTSVYGDSFISGWETGGELNAIISIKVRDKSKVFEVKGELEGELSGGAVAGKVGAALGLNKSSLAKETETTISVNWSGGGRIKNPEHDWDIRSIKAAAAAFPDLVAITPQRTYAILTKYTSLQDFQKKKKTFSPLSYENAGIYTSALMEHYMDYKSMWKQISQASLELESRRATIDMAAPYQDIADLAVIETLPADQVQVQTIPSTQGAITPAATVSQPSSTAPATEQDKGVPDRAGQLDVSIGAMTTEKKGGVTTKKFGVFPPSFAGLIQARQVCRGEMAKIVNEVDLVAKDPNLATDARRDSHFLNPVVFKQLLPVMRSLSPENAILGIKDTNAALLLGYEQPFTDERQLPKLYELNKSIERHDAQLLMSVQKLRPKANDYRMQGCAGNPDVVSARSVWFNDLDRLDATYRPIRLAVWSAEGKVSGLRINYANGLELKHGKCEDSECRELVLDFQGSEVVTEVQVQEAKDSKDVEQIATLSVATSSCNVLPCEKVQPTKTQTWTKSDQRHWSLRGFFGFYDNEEGAFVNLGVVWGKDSFVPVPMVPTKAPLAKHYLGLSSPLQTMLKTTLSLQQVRSEDFYMSAFISTRAATSPQYFNALNSIGAKWMIKSIAFSAGSGGGLAGLRVTYENGKELRHGTCTTGPAEWECAIAAPIVVVKLTTAITEGLQIDYVNTVELIKCNADGNLPDWPLDIATARYLGSAENPKQTSELVERAPTLARANWSVRGFFGEVSEGLISRLGIVWGCG